MSSGNSGLVPLSFWSCLDVYTCSQCYLLLYMHCKHWILSAGDNTETTAEDNQGN